MASASDDRKPRRLEQVRELLRIRHYSIRTEQAYLQWIRRFILYHGRRHPKDMGADEVTAFLSHLAIARHVACVDSESGAQRPPFLISGCTETESSLAQ